jgi:hypothetical protein
VIEAEVSEVIDAAPAIEMAVPLHLRNDSAATGSALGLIELNWRSQAETMTGTLHLHWKPLVA